MTLLTFPPLNGIVYPVKKKPIMSTALNRSVSGKVNALQLMSYPLWNWDVGYSFLRSETPNFEYETLLAFWLQCGGRANAFQFHDVDDDTATAQAFGAGDGVETEFQLVRTLTGGAFAFVEPVFAPLTITEITVAGAPTAAYTESGGLITFTSPPGIGDALAWTGTYNWVARFDDDVAGFEKFADKFWRLGSITFTSEPL